MVQIDEENKRGDVLSEVRDIRESGIVQVGHIIVRKIFVDSSKGGVLELPSWACDLKEPCQGNQDLATMTLAKLVENARNNAMVIATEGDLEQSSYRLFEHPRPAGYITQTRPHFGGIPVRTLIDSGASANVILEEVAVVLLG